MAAITTCISGCVAYLASELLAMDSVHDNLVSTVANSSVTIFTARRLHTGIAVIRLTLIVLPVQIGTAVAISAFHSALTEVDICEDAFMFACIFIAHAAAMTSCAIARHGWGLVK